jgi:hypothetical protein
MSTLQKSISTLITDSILDPYVIGQEKHGGFIIMEKTTRINKSTQENTPHYKPVIFPATFSGALEYIIKQKLCNKERYSTLQEYINDYKKIKEDIYSLVG